MSSINTISVEKLSRLIGTLKCPVIVDVRTDAEFAADNRLIPGSVRRHAAALSAWPEVRAKGPVVVACSNGADTSPGIAAWLRASGRTAEVLDGGVTAWASIGEPLVPQDRVPPRDAQDRTVWVTRERPKIDRIACPWLIRRFVDPDAVFLFVAPGQVATVTEKFGATPFDVEDVFWSHRGELCTFDVMVEEFGLSQQPLRRLATIVRGADTARHDLAPETAGLLAISLGLSRMFADDLEQLEAGLLIYDALYRWCRDATGETHDWIPASQRSSRVPATGAKS
ncbi:MAG: chromate resistance protein ChrB domain-containing protein [Bauldia sp.]